MNSLKEYNEKYPKTIVVHETKFYTLTFSFEEFYGKTMFFNYGYNGEAIYRAKNRKIYTDKKGKYFNFQRMKIYFE